MLLRRSTNSLVHALHACIIAWCKSLQVNLTFRLLSRTFWIVRQPAMPFYKKAEIKSFYCLLMAKNNELIKLNADMKEVGGTLKMKALLDMDVVIQEIEGILEKDYCFLL